MKGAFISSLTEFSLLDGANRIDKLVATAKADGQKALAITDHGNLYGGLRFYNECIKQDIKPILGIEAYVASKTRLSKHSKLNGYNHLTLLASTNEGLQNLMLLTSLSFIEGNSTKPRIDMEILSKHSKGLICLSGCISSTINDLLLRGEDRLALNFGGTLQDMFGKENLFIELQRNGLNIQEKATEGCVDISKKILAPLVATNDIHYLRKEDCSFHDTLLCINTARRKNDENRFRFEVDSLYCKTQYEMNHMFKDIPEAIGNINQAVEQCNIDIPQGTFTFPDYNTGKLTAGEYLKKKTKEGLKKLYSVEELAGARKRAKAELETIEKMGFSPYFLIVSDFVNYAKSAGIPTGPGRGSAAGCIVSYALGITSLDPIKYKLIFSRFLSTARASSPPDIDVDICKDRRVEIVNYLKDKYGDDKVANMIAFGTFQQKSAVRDVGRVLSIPLPECNIIQKKLDGKDLVESVKLNEDLQAAKVEHPELFETVADLEGMTRLAGTHASGYVISKDPLYNLVPLARNIKDGTIVTQWDQTDCENVGLVKFDLLGLETLTVIERIQDLIEKRHGKRVDLESLTFDDPKVYSLLKASNTEGIFQCYSDGMKRLFKTLQPETFEHIIAALALNRPGPLGSGITQQFLDRKNGLEKVSYIHPDVEEYLEDTYGTMVYQEQIMQLTTALAGFTLEESDTLRKAIGKKNEKLLVSMKEKFLNGTKNLKKISEAEAYQLWADIIEFGEYGFNLSHSAAYSVLTYYTAYLKAHYLIEFLTANLTQQIGEPDKTKAFLLDCQNNNIDLVPPDLYDLNNDYTVVDDHSIGIGLGGIKGLGPVFIKEFQEVDFTKGSKNIITTFSLIPGGVRKNVLESLIKAGLLDSFGYDRGQLVGKLEELCKAIRKTPKNVIGGSGGLFGGEIEVPIYKGIFDPEDTWTLADKLRGERDVFGFYMSGHPMREKAAAVCLSGATPIKRLLQYTEKQKKCTMAGVISLCEDKVIKKGPNTGKKYARLIVEDTTDHITCVIFAYDYPKIFPKIEEMDASGIPVFFMGRVVVDGDKPQFVITGAKPLSESRQIEKLVIDIDANKAHDFNKTKAILEQNPGDLPLSFNINDGVSSTLVQSQYCVTVTNELVKNLEGYS
jgi:DNA polymerase III subunit alpha